MKNIISKKRIVILIIAIAILMAGICIFYISGLSKSNKVAQNLDTIDVLTRAEETAATKLVKENVVKIVNTLDDGNTIIGTGFFHESGYLLTNSHVVDIKGSIEIFYLNGDKAKAELISNDLASDVAALYVSDIKVKALKFGSTSLLEEPMSVISIGYAYNLEGDPTVTKGSFSSRRSMAGVEYLQSDAALNYGNSGGPLIDDKGNLLGMNSYAAENASINFSISSESLENIVSKLIDSKSITYVEGQRPSNALSGILKSVGYSIDDIYNESEYLTGEKKIDDETQSDNQTNKSEASIETSKSTSIVTPKESSEAGDMKVTSKNEIPVTENNHTIKEIELADNINSLYKMSVGVSIKNTSTGYQLSTSINFNNKYNEHIPAADTSLYGTFKIEVFKKSISCYYNDDLENNLSLPDANTTGPIQIMTKTFNSSDVITTPVFYDTAINIPLSEIYSLLSPSDFTGYNVSDGMMGISVRVTMNTLKNGEFVEVSSSLLPPQ